MRRFKGHGTGMVGESVSGRGSVVAALRDRAEVANGVRRPPEAAEWMAGSSDKPAAAGRWRLR